MRLDIEPHLARILAMETMLEFFELFLMAIPVSFPPAAISLSLQLPLLLTPSLGADAITENKGLIHKKSLVFVIPSSLPGKD